MMQGRTASILMQEFLTVISLLFLSAIPVLVEAFTVSGKHQFRSKVASCQSRSTLFVVACSCARSPSEDDSGTVLSNNNIQSPVLRQVFPSLLEYKQKYGHPNIPLGTSEGRQCRTLRRLQTQQKLSESDVALLDDLGFTWHSLEDVYELQKEHFDDFLVRLKQYAESNDGDLSPPKKYAPDPELGAWVTALRRLYAVNAVDTEHVDKLNELGFSWISPRKCGSKFMQQYRALKDLLSGDDSSSVWSDPEVIGWIRAQQKAELSETRQHYMQQLLGADWKEWNNGA